MTMSNSVSPKSSDGPLLGRFVFDAENLSLRVFDALLVQDDARLKVEEVVARPLEHDLVVIALLRDVDEPECLADKGLDLEVASDDEAECRELARTCETLEATLAFGTKSRALRASMTHRN